jgi:ElaB/YqjD/DUF883 family membrane-anchored ribosome-binding protein
MDTTPTMTTKPGAVPADTSAKNEHASASLRALIDEAQQVLKTTARAGDERLETVRHRLQDEVHHLRAQIDELEAQAATRIRHAAKSTDHAVHDHPYAAMGLAAVAGVLLGVVLGRR